MEIFRMTIEWIKGVEQGNVGVGGVQECRSSRTKDKRRCALPGERATCMYKMDITSGNISFLTLCLCRFLPQPSVAER